MKEQIVDLIKRGYRRKYVADRPRPDSLDKRFSDNRPTEGDIQVIHGGFGSRGCSSSSQKIHARNASERAEEEVYNLFSPATRAYLPITFINDDVRDLYLPHDDALVISTTIASFNMQRILVDNGSSMDILFTSHWSDLEETWHTLSGGSSYQ